MRVVGRRDFGPGTALRCVPDADGNSKLNPAGVCPRPETGQCHLSTAGWPPGEISSMRSAQ